MFVLVASVVATDAALAIATCAGQPADIVGTSGSDFLKGTSKADVIVGRGGNDEIASGRGNDVICAGRGRDSILAGAGDDVAYGGSGIDSLAGDAGNDELHAQGGRQDRFSAGGRSGDGNDLMDGGPGLDLVDFYGNGQGVVVDLTAQSATGAGTDQLIGIDVIFGTAFDDQLTGNDQPNQFAARAGNDTINTGGGGVLSGGGSSSDAFSRSDLVFPEAGNDSITGGDGFDAVGYFDAPGPITIDLSKGTAVGDGTDALSGVEGALTSRNEDVLIGDDADNAFALAGGGKTVDGGGGTDLVMFLYAFTPDGQEIGVDVDLDAGTAVGSGTTSLTGIENVWGTRKNDMIRGDAGPNVLKGRGGDDQLFGGENNDVLNGGPGSDSGDGGSGTDNCILVETSTGCENP